MVFIYHSFYLTALERYTSYSTHAVVIAEKLNASIVDVGIGHNVVAAYAEDLQLRNAKATSIRICVQETRSTAPEQVTSEAMPLHPKCCKHCILRSFHVVRASTTDFALNLTHFEGPPLHRHL